MTVEKKATRGDIAAVATPQDGQTCFLAEARREGLFVFRSGDLSQKVTSDPRQGVYIARAGGNGTNGAWVRADTRLTTAMFGAVHDYNPVTQTGTDDYAAIQAAINFAGDEGGGLILLSGGIALTSRAVRMRDFVTLRGEDSTSGVHNPATPAPTGTNNPGQWGHEHAAFRTGYWVYNWVGTRPFISTQPGTSNPGAFTREIDMYAIDGPVSESDTILVLGSEADAAVFQPGQIYYLRSAVARYREIAGPREVEIPLENSLVRCRSVSGRNVRIERPAGFNAAGGYLCRIKPGAMDENGFPIHFVQGCRIEDLSVSSQLNFHNAVGMYECHIRNIRGNLRIVTGGNGYAWSSWDGFEGTFTERVCEVKFCSHNSVIRNIKAACLDHQDGGSIIAFGEQIRDVVLENFEIWAPTWDDTTSNLVTILQSRRCIVRNGLIFAPAFSDSNAATAVAFLAGEIPAEKAIVENVDITFGGNNCVYFGGPGTTQQPLVSPKECEVRECRFTSRFATAAYAVSFVGGTGNRVIDCLSPGGIRFSGGTGNLVRGCTLGSSAVTGTVVTSNRQFDNLLAVAGSNTAVITPTP